MEHWLGDPNAIILQLLRWIHFIFGVIWIGHLYFFNFVNGPFEKGLDAGYKKFVVTALRPRALWWFRWGAMLTFLSGLTYLGLQGMNSPDYWQTFFGHEHQVLNVQTHKTTTEWVAETSNWWITLGGLFGTIMWFNVWFVIWPRQKKILAGVATGNKPADFDQMVNTATFASRMNTFLSFPLLFAMGARQHFPNGVAPTLVWMGIVTAVGFAVAYHFIFMIGPAVGKSFMAMIPPAAPAAPPAPPK